MFDMSPEAVERRHRGAYEKLNNDTANLEYSPWLFLSYLDGIYHDELEAHWEKGHMCPHCGKWICTLPPRCSCGCERLRGRWVMAHRRREPGRTAIDNVQNLWEWLGDSAGGYAEKLFQQWYEKHVWR